MTDEYMGDKPTPRIIKANAQQDERFSKASKEVREQWKKRQGELGLPEGD